MSARALPGWPLALVMALALALALVAGCAAQPASSAGTPQPTLSDPPPPDPGMTTLLVVNATAGPAAVGAFTAEPGSLWVTGRCVGDHVVLHLDPVAELPVACEGAEGLPFLNQILMRRTTEVSVRVSADPDVIWNLRVQQ